MAEEKAAQETAAESASSSGQKPTLLIILVVVNMVVIGGLGAMLYLGKQKQEAKPGIDDVIQGEAEDKKLEGKGQDFIGKLIPLETFLVNLAGSRGRKLMKVNMELEVDGEEVATEVEKVKPKIRDIIIIILSSKSYAQVSGKDGKDILRSEIRDQVNLFLTRGQIKRVYFTELIFN